LEAAQAVVSGEAAAQAASAAVEGGSGACLVAAVAVAVAMVVVESAWEVWVVEAEGAAV